MDKYIGRIWVSLAVLAVALVIFFQHEELKPINIKEGKDAFLVALTQLGVLYIVALFVERSLEVLMKAWRQGGKIQREEKTESGTNAEKAQAKQELAGYRAGTQRRALLVGLTFGILVSLSGVRLLGEIFDPSKSGASAFQLGVFQFTDIIVTAGLIAGGSSTIHEVMALIDKFLKKTRDGTK